MINYEGMKAERAVERETLKAGGYVEEILDAKIENTAWGDKLIISTDIEEGDYKGFFANDYRNNPREDKKWRNVCRLNIPSKDSQFFETQQRIFNNFIASLEDSNKGFKFDGDETKLKGLLVGGLHRNKEWEFNGNTGWTTELYSFIDANRIRSGNFKMPKDKPLANKPIQASQPVSNTSAVEDDELPF